MAATSRPSAALAAAPTMADWVSVHAFYPDNLDPILVGAVDPLIRELTDRCLVDGFFFIRYWDGGNHLRLRCRPTTGNRATVGQAVADRLVSFLRDHPGGEVDPQAYAARAAALARGERVPDYHRQPQPANSVAFFPYQREHGRYGYGESMAAVERHFVQCSKVTLGWLVTGLTPAERSTAALAVTLLAWYCAGFHLTTTESVLPPEPSPVADEAYQRQRERLHQLTVRMRQLAARAGGATGAGGLLTWARSARRLHETLSCTRDGDPGGVLDLSAHLACNRLGIDLHEERHLRRLAARSLAAAEENETTAPSGGPA